MPRSSAFVSIVLFALAAAGLTAQERRNQLKEQWVALDSQGDQDAVVELWRANAERTLGTIDSDLEGALALWENAAGKPDDATAKAIAEHQARAIRGARAADRAFGTVIFGDYATSFAALDAEGKKRFRAGQAAHGAAQQLLKNDDAAGAAAKAKEVIALARPLGDWWGTAMGLAALGAAAAQAGDHEAALDAHQQARLIHHDLRLLSSEFRSLLGMARALKALNRRDRLAAVLADARALAEARKDARGLEAVAEIAD